MVTGLRDRPDNQNSAFLGDFCRQLALRPERSKRRTVRMRSESRIDACWNPLTETGTLLADERYRQAQVLSSGCAMRIDHRRSTDGARSLEVLAGDPQLPHHRIQCCAWNTQTSGSFAHHFARLAKNTDYMIPFHLLQRVAGGG